MKILHTADWHIGQFKGPVVDGVNLRSQDTVKCLEYMVDVAIKERPDIVCISGDIFHQEQIGPVRYSDEMIHATNIITSLAHFAGYGTKVAASSSTGYADGQYTNKLDQTSDGLREWLSGGYLGSWSDAGRWCAYLDYGLGVGWWGCAARLSASGRCAKAAA